MHNGETSSSNGETIYKGNVVDSTSGVLWFHSSLTRGPLHLTEIMPENEALSSMTGGILTKKRAKARWSILRNALLQKSQTQPDETQHSIHRFPGYRLLERKQGDLSEFVSSNLQQLEWDSTKTPAENVDRLVVASFAVAATFPKGKCIDIVNVPTDDSIWIKNLKESCKPAVSLLLVDEKRSSTRTFLVQETKSGTKYAVYENVLDPRCSIWTREPLQTRLSLDDLVSHRRTGVDNTGNVCVWESECTLAHFLYHHYREFGCWRGREPRRILELGTGMAGLAAVALGMRLLQLKEGPSASSDDFGVQVTLTDGHPGGVQNNRVNKLLTQLSTLKDGITHLYHALSICEQILLWTTDARDGPSSLPLEDVVLVSDCIHFQTFHSALAITALRSLRLGGVAIFCQPARGDSLDNFCKLLTTNNVKDLVSMEWWTHPILLSKDEQAVKDYPEVYDRNLHCPKILIVQKLRELSEHDCHEFVSHQEARNRQ